MYPCGIHIDNMCHMVDISLNTRATFYMLVTRKGGVHHYETRQQVGKSMVSEKTSVMDDLGSEFQIKWGIDPLRTCAE